MCIALSAYSCRDSRGFGGNPSAPHSRLSPFRGAPARSMKAGIVQLSPQRLVEVNGKANNPCRVFGEGLALHMGQVMIVALELASEHLVLPERG